MRTSQDIMKEIDSLYNKYENEVLLAKEKGFLMDNTVKTYLVHSGNFVKWCRGNFVPGDRNAPKSTTKTNR